MPASTEPLPEPTSSTIPATAIPTVEASATPDNSALIDELNEIVFPLEGIEPTSDQADLAPLVEIIGDARIVGLGEATHGTHEFMMMSGRIVRMLVEEQGFKVLAFEAPWAQIEIVDQYVQGEMDDKEAAIEALYNFSIRTEEIWGLIEWLREHNADLAPESRVHVAGFDPQSSTEPAIEMVLTYIEEVDPEGLDAFSEQYTIVNDLSGVRPALQEAQAAFEELAARRGQYTEASPPHAFDLALQAARVIVQDQELQVMYNEGSPIDIDPVFNLRDQFMADNVDWLLGQAGPEARIALWGHNTHISTCSALRVDLLTLMGNHLRAVHGTEYAAVGYDFAEGSFTSTTSDPDHRIATHHTAEILPTTFAYVFRELAAPVFLLDLTDLAQSDPNSHIGTWLSEEHQMWGMGSGYDPGSPYALRTMRLPACFDALIFFEETTASTVIEQ